MSESPSSLSSSESEPSTEVCSSSQSIECQSNSTSLRTGFSNYSPSRSRLNGQCSTKSTWHWSATRKMVKPPIQPNGSFCRKARSRFNSQDLHSIGERHQEEANLSMLENSEHSGFDYQTMFNNDVFREMSNHNMAKLAGTVYDPERFLVANNQGLDYLEREVNAHKLHSFMVDYMSDYYDLTTDQNAFSEARQIMDDQLWDSLAYIIPVLCQQVVRQVLHDEPMVVTCHSNTIVFGDLHGNLNDIYYIYRHFLSNRKYDSYQFIFLGDYVDRGPKGVEVATFLFTCKLINPRKYVLLRGNHEVAKVNKKYAFQALIDHIFGEIHVEVANAIAPLIYRSFNRTFNYLPLVALVTATSARKGIFCCHGGIPSQDLKRNRNRAWRIAEIMAISRKPHSLVPSRNASNQHLAMNEILWNDPIPKRVLRKKGPGKLFYRNRKRGGHCSWFTKEALNLFLTENNLDMIIRGHQFRFTKPKGYHYQFGKRILTVFSSSNYSSEENVTGYVLITEHTVKPFVLRQVHESRRYAEFNVFHYKVDNRTKQITELVF